MEWLLALVASLGLYGSIQNKTKVEQVVEYHTTVVIPPSDLLQNCLIATVPDVDVYVASTWPVKEQLLVNALTQAQKNAILCNVQLESLRNWKDTQMKIYADPVKSKQPE